MQDRIKHEDKDHVRVSRLKEALERAFERYRTHYDIKNDPIMFLTQYKDPLDKEAVGFIASSFAFGSVRQFMPVIGKILSRLGPKPAQALSMAQDRDIRDVAKGITYRFAKETDISTFLAHLGRTLRRFGSLKEAFMVGYRTRKIFIDGLSSLATEIRRNDEGEMTDEVKVFVPDPKKNSAMKRLCMFSRWMVRRDFPDFALWQEIEPRELIIPLDTHVFRVLRFLGLLKGARMATMKSAVKATDALRQCAPDDPLRYDFALAHLGISKDCKGHFVEDVCNVCPLGGLCVQAKGFEMVQ
jgi:uncharacterized protein (TIGR02757 family)